VGAGLSANFDELIAFMCAGPQASYEKKKTTKGTCVLVCIVAGVVIIK